MGMLAVPDLRSQENVAEHTFVMEHGIQGTQTAILRSILLAESARRRYFVHTKLKLHFWKSNLR